MKKKILAIIPARQGSKRIPQKNMRLLNNKPLISCFISDFIDPKFEAITNVSFLNASIIESGKPPSYNFDGRIKANDSFIWHLITSKF